MAGISGQVIGDVICQVNSGIQNPGLYFVLGRGSSIPRIVLLDSTKGIVGDGVIRKCLQLEARAK